VIFDSDMVARGVPAFNVATRGLTYFHLTVRTGARDLHSGMYGGAALNAMHALTEILGAVVPREGHAPEPLRAGIAPLTDEERASWAALPGGEEELGGQGARPMDPRATEDFYARTWAEKYGGQALVVIGVHTPEFSFEKDVDNVRRALKEMGIVYPVALDSDYAVWRAFENQYWPALYFVDARGRVRHHHFGEGEYEQSERVIRQLLTEAGAGVDQELVSVEARGAEAAADWGSLKSPENYVGYGRTENFASPGGLSPDKGRVYSAPARLSLNQWALAGEWTVEKGAVALNKPGGRIAYGFHARDLHLVMGPSARGASARFRVTLDGQPAGAAHGVDVDEQGNGTVREQRLYQLIRQPKPITERRFEIEFLDAGAEAYAFTFG